jgi:hypothetical protein
MQFQEEKMLVSPKAEKTAQHLSCKLNELETEKAIYLMKRKHSNKTKQFHPYNELADSDRKC